MMIAIPHMGTVSTDMAEWLWKIKNDDIDLLFSTHVPVESNRNFIVKKFLESKHEYLFMVDSDNTPKFDPMKLCNGKDMYGFPTPVFKDGQMMYMICKDFGDGFRAYLHKSKGEYEVDAVGTGCVLIHRRVLEAIKAPFDREYDKDGVAIVGEDINFCKKVKKQGFKIWVNWDCICSHHKTVNLLNFI